MKIALISCSSKKLRSIAKAKELYSSPLFRLSLGYALSLTDKVFILSAKYGLLEPEQEIQPYNITLNSMAKLDRKKWAAQVLSDLGKVSNLSNDEFIFLAGKKYREFLVPCIKNYQAPLEHLGIGKQLKFLSEKLK
jgi:cytoplasmic iron level regulating protein YaaA (DUF328/UPF0246 family)